MIIRIKNKKKELKPVGLKPNGILALKIEVATTRQSGKYTKWGSWDFLGAKRGAVHT
jgi:hypothetical protein